jgi:hypothetical protein
MKKADNFDPSKWLVENKITTQSRLNEERTMMIPSSLVNRYVNMKYYFKDKAGDPTIKAKLIPIITDFFPKNQDISFQELEDKFGEETARQTIQVLNGAYLDGYLDSFYKPITNLYQDYLKKYFLNENLDVLKKVLNKYLNKDKNTNIEDVGKAFRKLDSKFHNEAFDYIEDKADYLLDDDVFYATAGFPVDTR